MNYTHTWDLVIRGQVRSVPHAHEEEPNRTINGWIRQVASHEASKSDAKRRKEQTKGVDLIVTSRDEIPKMTIQRRIHLSKLRYFTSKWNQPRGRTDLLSTPLQYSG